MNKDLFLAILALDSYNRGYGKRLVVTGSGDGRDTGEVGRQIGNATITAQDITDQAFDTGFYAISYEWNGETIISYRGTDGLNDITEGWTTGAGWTDQAQANLAVEFYNAATGHDAFDLAIPANVTLTGHSLGGGLAGFVSMTSGGDAVNDNYREGLAA